MNKQEIADRLEVEVQRLIKWYKEQSNELFSHSGEEGWSAGQHLYHMIKSTDPLANGMSFPAFLVKLKYGKAKAPSRTYEEVVKAYQSKLSAGAVATGEYVPRPIANEEKEALIKQFEQSAAKLKKNILSWKESNLDSIAVPHPIIGKMTLREVLYFTVYHTSHHAEILKNRYPLQ